MAFIIENSILIKYTVEPGVTEVIIPDGIVEIGEFAFRDCEKIVSIVIPDGVKRIDRCAFYMCSNLKDIVFPDSIEFIGDSAFYCTDYGEKLRRHPIPEAFTMAGKVLLRYNGKDASVIIPEGTTAIYGESFINCKHVNHVGIPESVTHIGWGAFSGSGLKEVQMPSTLVHIAAHAFDETPWINSLSKPGQPEYVCGGRVLLRYNGSDPVVYIPDGIVGILERAFSPCYVTGIRFREEETLKEVHLPESMTNIANNAFWKCSKLEKIVIPGKVTIDRNFCTECSEKLVVVAPHYAIENATNTAEKRALGWGYLLNSDLYTDPEIAVGYQKYVSGQKKYYLPIIFKEDRAECIAAYAGAKKITKSNVDKDYLEPAIDAGATQCTAWLLEWKQQIAQAKK